MNLKISIIRDLIKDQGVVLTPKKNWGLVEPGGVRQNLAVVGRGGLVRCKSMFVIPLAQPLGVVRVRTRPKI